MEDGEGLELEGEQGQDGHCGGEDVEVHVDVGGHVELDGVTNHVHGGEDGGSCDGEESGGLGWRDDVGGEEYGLHAEVHGGEAEEDQVVAQSVQLALHDKDQPPPQPVDRILLFQDKVKDCLNGFPRQGSSVADAVAVAEVAGVPFVLRYACYEA